METYLNRQPTNETSQPISLVNKTDDGSSWFNWTNDTAQSKRIAK